MIEKHQLRSGGCLEYVPRESLRLFRSSLGKIFPSSCPRIFLFMVGVNYFEYLMFCLIGILKSERVPKPIGLLCLGNFVFFVCFFVLMGTTEISLQCPISEYY